MLEYFLCDSSVYEDSGVEKKCNLMSTQNSENGVPVQARAQFTVIGPGSFQTSKLSRFGCTFGSVNAPM